MTVAAALMSSTIGNRPLVHGQFLDQRSQEQEEDLGNHRYQRNRQQPGANNGRLTVVDSAGRHSVSLLPGLLEESLLKRGSFDFNSKLVKFDKLKVLGNIYVHRINGHKLRDHYLLKSNSMQPPSSSASALPSTPPKQAHQ